jgi:predicted small secreted protein
MVRKIMTVFALSTSLVLAACNTLGGLGEDVESVGDCVADEANGGKC